MSGQVFNFQDIQEEDVQVMLPFEPKKNQPWRRVEFKRKWWRLKKVEEDGNEKSRKVWEDCNVAALIVVCQGDGAPKLF
jgi:hypothetical protein